MKMGYARVSTDEQDTAAQVAALEAYGCEVIYKENQQVKEIAQRPAQAVQLPDNERVAGREAVQRLVQLKDTSSGNIRGKRVRYRAAVDPGTQCRRSQLHESIMRLLVLKDFAAGYFDDHPVPYKELAGLSEPAE